MLGFELGFGRKCGLRFDFVRLHLYTNCVEHGSGGGRGPQCGRELVLERSQIAMKPDRWAQATDWHLAIRVLLSNERRSTELSRARRRVSLDALCLHICLRPYLHRCRRGGGGHGDGSGDDHAAGGNGDGDGLVRMRGRVKVRFRFRVKGSGSGSGARAGAMASAKARVTDSSTLAASAIEVRREALLVSSKSLTLPSAIMVSTTGGGGGSDGGGSGGGMGDGGLGEGGGGLGDGGLGDCGGRLGDGGLGGGGLGGGGLGDGGGAEGDGGGGDGGGGLGDGGGGEGGGELGGGSGGEGGGSGVGGSCTTKDLIPWAPSARVKVCPKPGAAHSPRFQPSPPSSYESVMSRVHVAPSVTASGALEVYGAPPLSVVPSEQLRLQPTLPR